MTQKKISIYHKAEVMQLFAHTLLTTANIKLALQESSKLFQGTKVEFNVLMAPLGIDPNVLADSFSKDNQDD